MSFITHNASTAFKINATIDKSVRAAFSETTIKTGLKTDGSPKMTIVHWMLTTTYKLDRAVNFSLSYQEYAGKEKGNFLEVARLVPSQKTGLTLEFSQSSRISTQGIRRATENFLNLYTAELNVNRGDLPRQFYVLASVFHQCKVSHSDSIDQVSTIAPFDTDQVWKDAIAALPSVFPQFYCLTPVQTVETKAIESTDSDRVSELKKLKKTDLQQLCLDSEIAFVETDTKEILISYLSEVSA